MLSINVGSWIDLVRGGICGEPFLMQHLISGFHKPRS
jgi:hypothetical protein